MQWSVFRNLLYLDMVLELCGCFFLTMLSQAF